MRFGHLLLLYGAAAAGIAAWHHLDPQGFTKTTSKARKKVEKTTGARLPRPEIALEGPQTDADFDVLDEFLCEAGSAVQLEDPDLLASDPEAFADRVTLHALSAMYPDFPWPAVVGDHPSVAELQGLLRFEARRGILDRTLCLTQDALSQREDLEAEDDGAVFLPPPEMS